MTTKESCLYIDGDGNHEYLTEEEARLKYLKAIKPVELILFCPACAERHYDEGEFATKPHHTHACQCCGFVWRPAIEPTKGIRFLKGFRND